MSTNGAKPLALKLSVCAFGGDDVGDDPLATMTRTLRAAAPQDYGSAKEPLAKLFGAEAELARGLVLHAIASNEKAVLAHSASLVVFRELETRLRPEFWKRASIDSAKLQRNELAAVLGREIREIERSIVQVVSRQPSVRDLNPLVADVSKVLKDPRTTALIGAVSSWIRSEAEVRSALQAAARTSAETTLVEYEGWQRAYHLLDERLRHSGLPLDLLLVELLRRVDSILSELIDELGLREPAMLRIGGVLRRLPLDLPGHQFRLPLVVENVGKGAAVTPRLRVEICGRAEFDQRGLSLGDRLEKGSLRVDLTGRVAALEIRSGPTTAERLDDEALVSLTWLDWRGEEQRIEEIISIRSQRPGIDWSALEGRTPYNLEPVERASELFGREALVNQLLAAFRLPEVGSAFIIGHKRVGKTSLAQAVLNRLNDENGIVTIFRDAGSINNPDPAVTIDNLVARWVRSLKKSVPKLANLPDVQPTGALSGLQNFLEDALDLAPDLKLVLALDEFDRLPGDLLRRTAAGDSFFSTLRSITSLRGVGLLLIGGEAMKLVLTGPGGDLNKPMTVQVDTIDRKNHWSDFVELVRSPVDRMIDISDEAVDAVYRWSEGNPYYAKNILRRAYATATAMRHDEIMEDEIDAAARELVSREGAFALTANNFAHYWEDYLLERGAEADAITLNRRRVLLALSELLRSRQPTTTEAISEVGVRFGLERNRCAAELDQFRQRGLLERDGNGNWSPRLPIFAQWLVERGPSDITMNVTELQSEAQLAARERELIPDYDEVRDWCRTAGFAYRATALDADRVIRYLRQFGGGTEQRAMFDLLRRIRFMRPDDVRSTFESMHALVLVDLKEQGPWRKEEILLTAVDGLGKSQQSMAREYCEAAHLLTRVNLLAVDTVIERVAQGTAKVVILADDFAGTGQTICDSLRDMAAQNDVIRTVPLYVFVAAGFDSARSRVLETFDQLGLTQAYVRFGVVLEDDDRALAPGAFASDAARSVTAEVLHRWGHQLEPKHPLGYGNCQALIVFDRTTPNNTVPVLWKGMKGFDPLFPRSSTRR